MSSGRVAAVKGRNRLCGRRKRLRALVLRLPVPPASTNRRRAWLLLRNQCGGRVDDDRALAAAVKAAFPYFSSYCWYEARLKDIGDLVTLSRPLHRRRDENGVGTCISRRSRRPPTRQAGKEGNVKRVPARFPARLAAAWFAGRPTRHHDKSSRTRRPPRGRPQGATLAKEVRLARPSRPPRGPASGQRAHVDDA